MVSQMHEKLSISKIVSNLRELGVAEGDTILVRGDLSKIGRIKKDEFVDALILAVGNEGTVVSLSFTTSSFITKADIHKPYTLETPSNAGSLPNAMLQHKLSKRSAHPTNSVVAIGKYAEYIIDNHGPDQPAFEPIRKIVDLNGKMLLVGCVSTSPGFTTAHLVEYDLGLHKRLMFPWLNNIYYISNNNELKLYRRNDPGLCSKSFYKFYAHYVKSGILLTGNIGKAYSILAPAKKAYDIEKYLLTENPKFNICEETHCAVCNLLRYDRLHRVPLFIFKKIINKIIKVK